jgi:uncharacterized protein
MRSVCIAGGSGFIGFNLVHRLYNEGFNVILITRDDFQNGELNRKVGSCSIVINLIGESIAGLWTIRKRKRIYNSRVHTAKKIVDAINQSGDMVELLIQVSGVGIYDHQHIHTEDSHLYDDGFLSRVIIDWESELDNIRRDRLRIVILRLGIVLDKSGGMLKMFMYPLQLSFGFVIKSEDYLAFVQLEDLMRVFMFCIENKKIGGVVNVAAPVFTRIDQFFEKVFELRQGKIMIRLNREFIRLLMGDSGSLLTSGQRVIPAKLQNEGFVFKYDNIEDALIRACN